MSATLSAAILCIGTELTRGEIDNTNATWLSQCLTALGADVTRTECVPDDAFAIQASLERLSRDHQIVAGTGGLGPTTDDITSLTVSQWLGVPSQRDPAVLAALRERLERRGRALTESNASQADFPEGAQILANPNGTAPGFAVSRGNCQLFFMPGVPREMKPMFERYIAPVVRSQVRSAQHQIRLHCFGVPESTLNDQLSGLEDSHRVTVGYRAHFPEVEVKLLCRAETADQSSALAHTAAAEARRRLGSAVYSQGDAELPEVVSDLLRARGLTLGLAESCTGGLLSALLTQRPVSDIFLGAVVSYANSAKQAQLGVDPSALERHGAVSGEVVKLMAEGARKAFGADLSISLSGIAGPSGGTADKPVGLVHYAVASSAGVVGMHTLVSERPRQDVQLYAAWCALDLLRRQLDGPWKGLGCPVTVQ